MKVGDLEIYDDFATVKNESILEAAKIMKEKDVPDLILIDDDNKPIGIISAVDIILKIVAEEKDPKEIKIATIARKVKSFDEFATRAEVLRYMMENDSEIVPIIKKDGTLLGVCTIGDVLIETKEDEEE
ncbi:MAG: CBS domain-containing protein [Candidatus Helarchaeota archaeon]|nr:CBS domain-containing protein [Candidatus Helarchaeota archaeon]